MNREFFRAVAVIARRDILATVLSRGFVVWLSMPIIGLAFGLVASLASGSGESERAAPEAIAVIDATGEFAGPLLEIAVLERVRGRYGRLRARFLEMRPAEPVAPELERPAALLTRTELRALRGAELDRIEQAYGLSLGEVGRALGLGGRPATMTDVPPDGTEEAVLAAQAERLLRKGSRRFGAVVVVAGTAGGDVTIYRRGRGTDIDHLRTLVTRAAERRALEARGVADAVEAARAEAPEIGVTGIDDEEEARRTARGAEGLATGAAVVLFSLISLLAGVLLSNMVEEKANKVIEVLVASVPVPAIFAGKLAAMLIVSLVGVGVWALVFGGGAAVILGQLPEGLVPVPERGWPAFAGLVLAYFITAYLIYGALYLGIGALCTSIREVQTLSMPVTILQMIILVATLAAIGRSGSFGAEFASWFPLSAPYMMAARAASGTGIALHMAAILWQLLFAAFIIVLSARLFRYGVLRSGPPPSLRQLGALLPRLRGRAEI